MHREVSYRAYCDDCGWEAEYSNAYEDSSYDDLNTHVMYEHAGNYGVREEIEIYDE